MAGPKRKRIPALTRLAETTRRLTKSLADDLHLTGTAGPKTRTRKTGGSSEPRPNPWPKCPTCHHRVPTLCTYCQQGRAGVTEHHDTTCCPGPCVLCARCKRECPGQCPKCAACLDRCPGHEEKRP